ncbi:NTP transferase domain-containing protein [Nesterenkonia pannonica]|uniref:molybdenum cofactor guanylyltransferase n=1 Tax=Nesterenkonia pannonica TaxID=1548602 RepID=UPI002164884D|nr:NTP transferase domain-containing protein [Nesterenkonia pannonica]
MSQPHRVPTAAVLLAGGQGRRLGGEDKASLLLRGRTLLQHWLTALRSEGIPEIVVVGPDELRPLCDAEGDTKLVRENPPFGGPAAAVYAGMKALEAMQGRVLLLAVDVVE